ncbi:MAG: ABC transporter permease [Candidatus Methanomethylicaceae archaeon]
MEGLSDPAMRASLNTSFFIRKFVRYFTLVFTIIFLNFAMPRLMPGDPLLFLFGEEVYGAAIRNPELIQSLSAKYGLNKPIFDQFIIYLGNLFRGDLGYSFSYGRPIAEIIAERVPLTLLMTLPPTLLSLVTGAMLGLHLGFNPERAHKKAISSLLMVLYSVPPYWMAIVAILVFSLWFNLTPIGGAPSPGMSIITGVSHMILPFSVIALFNAAYVAIIMRGLTLEIAEEPFIITAKSKGLSYIKFKIRHLFIPSLAPFLSIAAIELGFTFSGALLVEIAFSWPGMGYTMWQAVVERDYPLLQATFTMTALIVVLANALADLASYAIDPRIRLRENGRN